MAELGRPAKFASVEQMQEQIDQYFNNLPTKKIGEFDVPVATMTGLALHLGFESRQSLYDYEKNGDFSYTVKRARLKIENEYEMQLRTSSSPSGAIFGLKNFGWSDKQELEHSGNPDRPLKTSMVVEFVNGPDEG